MNKTKIMMFLTIASATLLGVSNVDAKEYTSYKTGDEITVKVNDNTEEKFYVIKDSDGKNTEVTAIHTSTLGEYFVNNCSSLEFESCTANQKLKEVTKDWTNPTEIRLIEASEILPNYKELEENNEMLDYSDSIYHIGGYYWTQTSEKYIVDEDNFTNELYLSSVWGFYSALELDNEMKNTQAKIRPVVTVSKDYVVGGTYETEEDVTWTNFLEELKKSEYVKDIFEVEHTDNTLKLIYTDVDGSKYDVNFTYENGIITYVDDNNDSLFIINQTAVIATLDAISGIKGYDFESLIDWLDMQSEDSLTIEKDGIQFKTKEVEIEDINGGSVSGNRFTSYQLDINNGVKTYKPIVEEETPKEDIKNEEIPNEDEETIENPNTGLYSGIGAIALIGVLGSVIYLKSKKLNKFPQTK